MKKNIFIFILAMLICVGLFSQAEINNTASPQPIRTITIQRDTDFQTALKILETLSLQTERKNILNTSSYTGNVPIQINNIPWKDAFELIVKTVGLVIEDKPGVYIVSDVPVAQTTAPTPTQTSEYSVHDKMVRINATFLQVDKAWMNSIGIDWSTLSNGKVNGRISFQGNQGEGNLASAEYSRTDAWGNNTVDLNMLLGFIETNNKGSVLARPTITVLNGKEGYVQVGQDFSIKTKDENGNTTDEFFSTGLMLTVAPLILEDDGVEAIFLRSSVEKSNLVSHDSNTGIIINRNQARSDVMLFDGEETVIAGLIDSDISQVRSGFPILKDLPWWFFGLKYVFGWNSTRTTNSEMIVILKTEIVSPAIMRSRENIQLRDTFDGMRDDFKNINEELTGKRREAESNNE